MGLSTISRAKRDQTWREDVVTNGIGRVEGIAVDWIAGEPWQSVGLQVRQRMVGSGWRRRDLRRRGRREQIGEQQG